jgi:Raf kinase inhibitor-like YbhB/YbcL family protein
MGVKKTWVVLVILVVAALCLYLVFADSRGTDSQRRVGVSEEVSEDGMKLDSNAFENNSSIPSKYTCDADNVNPPLSISRVPENAKSLVLIVDDPDAPGGTFTHWIIWNMDPTAKEIAEASVPQVAVQGINDFGKVEYGGPCPPTGTHHYYFKLFALDTMLDLESSTKRKDLLDAMQGHILEEAQLVGLYKRS